MPIDVRHSRTHDCVFGGTNSISENRAPSAADTTAIVSSAAAFSESKRRL